MNIKAMRQHLVVRGCCRHLRRLKLQGAIVGLLCLSGMAASATTYHVDSVRGDDANRGTRRSQPWRSLSRVGQAEFQPGDRILLRSGSAWPGEQLWPKGSGRPGQAIQIDRYEEGPLPLLSGNGQIGDVVYLFNQQYWEIRNLEITNFREGDDPWDNRNVKRAVHVVAEDVGAVHHIHLKNLVIHDVNGCLGPDQFPSKNNGGIFFEVRGGRVETWYDGFWIEGCRISNVDRGGVSNISSWMNRTVTDNTGWVPSRNIVIRNNVFEGIGGNGLIVRAAFAPLVEHNLFRYCGKKLSGNAMFFAFCDDAVGQYNEAYEEVYEPGETDAAGFDIDIKNKRAIFQYNYSHNNGQGAFVICTGTGDPESDFQKDAVLRYNICENNRRRTVYISGHVDGTDVYNNVFYLGPELSENLILWHRGKRGAPDHTRYFNNIFYVLGPNNSYRLEDSTNDRFDSNVFYGQHPDTEPADPHKRTADPKFISPGSGGIGMDTVDGYRLRPDSPAIDSGVMLENHPAHDYWGNPVPYGGGVDRGAYEYHPEGVVRLPPWRAR